MDCNGTGCLSTEAAVGQFLDDVLEGLSRPQKSIPSKYFYDERGSQLFEQICELPEYYPTRTELSIMRRHCRAMTDRVGDCRRLVELGSGASIKTRILLDRLQPEQYVPVDIAVDALQAASDTIAAEYPHVDVQPLCRDFTEELADVPDDTDSVVYFPGSTIGNLVRDEAVSLMEQVSALCGSRGGFLVGVDLQKDLEILLPAYNDADGLTAEFNRNVLHRANRELDATFDVERFRHRAIYDGKHHRIEMHLVSECEQTAHVNGRTFEFDRNETICTEFSHKYTVDGFADMAGQAGMTLAGAWTDRDELFAVLWFLNK